MIDKEMLLYVLQASLNHALAEYELNDKAPFDGGICSALQDVIKTVNEQRERFEWINSDIVPVGSGYILLSFANFNVPLVGRYEEDEEGGAYYIGDETETCSSQELIVNAWMPLPEPYKED